MARFLSYSEATLGWVRRRACCQRGVQADVRALGRAHIQASRNRFERERRLRPEARRDSKLGRIALAPREQISLFPTEPAQLLGGDPFGLGWRRFPAQLARGFRGS